MVSLTGSIATGEHILAHTASSIKRTHMELGGKAPVIVFDDADIDAVIEGSEPLVSITPGRIAPPPVVSTRSGAFTTGWSPDLARRWRA